MHHVSGNSTVSRLGPSPANRTVRRRAHDKWRWARASATAQNSATETDGEALPQTISEAVIEASKAAFAAREPESTILRQRASSAYGAADHLDRTVPAYRRLTI